MSKIGIYRNPQYVLSYGKDDIVFLSIEVEITKETEDSFSVKVLKCQIEDSMEFVKSIIALLPTEGLQQVHQKLETDLMSELSLNSKSLFYISDVTD